MIDRVAKEAKERGFPEEVLLATLHATHKHHMPFLVWDPTSVDHVGGMPSMALLMDPEDVPAHREWRVFVMDGT